NQLHLFAAALQRNHCHATHRCSSSYIQPLAGRRCQIFESNLTPGFICLSLPAWTPCPRPVPGQVACPGFLVLTPASTHWSHPPASATTSQSRGLTEPGGPCPASSYLEWGN
ncbi:hypothetical protein AMECASPLE_028422, partial [Ameca splendens]